MPRTHMIYIDPIRSYPTEAIKPHAHHAGRKWCHLWTDPGNEMELHSFALDIGIKRAWFQDKPGFPHYDLTPAFARAAIKHGAILTLLREWRERRNLPVAQL